MRTPLRPSPGGVDAAVGDVVNQAVASREESEAALPVRRVHRPIRAGAAAGGQPPHRTGIIGTQNAPSPALLLDRDNPKLSR
jgi:hypothetical protein